MSGKPAQERLSADLNVNDTAFADLAVPPINNWQGREVTTGAGAREGLYHQAPSPVRWHESMRALAA